VYALQEDGSPICNIKFEQPNNFVVKLNGKDMSKSDINSTTISKTDLSQYAVLSCINNSNKVVVCKQTSAIIKSSDSKFYGISKSNTISNREMDLSNTSCTSNVGGLITVNDTVELCLSESVHAPLAEKENYNYVLDSTNSQEEGPFNSDNTEKSLLIRAYANYFINYITEGK